ncbi:hypothetical protein [Mycobacterium sp. 852002-51961_SCH5331710]|uniref:hypothetical protein n=1 Tax=Mycobacterium sp. 852002-51961_SCH5331710 TaxID=1834105 RepID=UPI0012E7D7FB|nr:hypothetical protein [Mycobacterium sp. 852002-51961_SCH5331710]
MDQFLTLPVPDDFYVTNKFREFAQDILNNFDEPTGDSPLVVLLAETIYNLEADYRIRLNKLEERLKAAGITLPPAEDD